MQLKRISLSLLLFCSSLDLWGSWSFKKELTETKKCMKVVKDFSLSGPKGWSVVDDKSQLPGKIDLIFVGVGKGGFTPSINVASEETTVTLEEYVKMATEYHLSQGETTARPLGKIKTKVGEAEVLQIDRKTQWGDVRFIQASLICDKKAYVITATCLTKEFSELSPLFFQTIRSFARQSNIDNNVIPSRSPS